MRTWEKGNCFQNIFHKIIFWLKIKYKVYINSSFYCVSLGRNKSWLLYSHMGQVWHIGCIGQQKPFKLPFQRKKLKPEEGAFNKCRTSQGVRLAAFRNQNILLNLSFLGAVWHGTCVIVSVLFRCTPTLSQWPKHYFKPEQSLPPAFSVIWGQLTDVFKAMVSTLSEARTAYYKQWVQRIVKYIVATNYSQVLRSNRKQGIELWLSNEHSTMYLALSFLLPSWLYLYYASVIRKFTCEITKWWFF